MEFCPSGAERMFGATKIDTKLDNRMSTSNQMRPASAKPKPRIKICSKCGLLISGSNRYVCGAGGRSFCRNCHKRASLLYVRRKRILKQQQARWEEEVGNLPASIALNLGLAVQCPTCRILHPGLHFSHFEHAVYCSTACFRARPQDA